MPDQDAICAVIGSGPSGHAAVRALLERGRKVMMIDAGQTLEPEAQALRDSLPDGAPALRIAQAAVPGGIGRYGSAHAIRPMDEVVETRDDLLLRSSHALGGLSNVWGSAVLPWSPDDTKDWPVGDMTPHYRAVSQFLPVAGARQGYDALLGTPDLDYSEPLPVPRQGQDLVARLARADADDLRTGAARQSVHPGCRSCGLCLYGCPWGLIHTTAGPIDDLRREGAIDYRKGEVVRIEETGDGVALTLASGETLTASRVFVAAGVLETARVMFASRPDLPALTLKESRHFFTPFLHSGLAGKPEAQPHHTLVQAFAELSAPEISPHLIHTQIYGWNDFYAREMAQSHGRGLPLGPLFRWLSRRLFAAQTFLHSSHCPTIRLTRAGDRLAADLVEAPDFDATVARARDTLASRLKKSGLYAIGRAGRFEQPGGSFHTGGTLPMTETPRVTETDPLGRPQGATRIHIVDASVLPAIPATTITFSVMANAHRIATHAPDA